MKKKKKSALGIIIFIVVLVLIAGVITAYILLTQKDPIPEGAIGNTSGNLNNHGLFCECDGYIYFSNSYDQRKLYRMKADGTEVSRIADVPVEYINVYDGVIYFYQTPGADNQIFGLGGLYGICYTDVKGKSGMNVFDKTVCNGLSMYGPRLYYQRYDAATGLSLWTVDINTGDKKEITDKEVSIAAPASGKFVTYNKDNGFLLSRCNLATGQIELFEQDTRAFNIIVEGNYVYYMNIDDSYKIYRMNMSDYTKTKLVDYTVDLFNVYGDYIYFQKSGPESPAIMRTRLDGSMEEIVEAGNFTDINCTEEYTYYYGFGEDAPIYRIANRPGAKAEVFNPQ